MIHMNNLSGLSICLLVSAVVTAFSVMRTGPDYVGPFPNATTAVYDEVRFVIGEGLDTATSVFTAPVGGLYLFMYGNHNGDSGLTVTELHVNGARTRYIRIDTYYESSSASGLLMLSPGDTVQIMLQPNDEMYCGQCYFDGVLLSQTV